jgi:hypothetical protein
MAEVDTSSYPKAALPVSPLEVAGKLGALQQQKLSIDQAKLDQANQGLTYLARAMSALGPNATKEQYKAAGDQVTRQLGLPPEKTAIWNEQVDAAPDGPTFFKRAMSQIGSHQEILNLNTGANADKSNGAVNYQGKVDPMTGGFTPATEMPQQPPPTQANVDTRQMLPNGQPNPNYGQPGIIGAPAPSGVYPARQGLPVASPASAAPPAAPVAQPRPRGLPVQPLSKPSVSGPTGPTKQTGFDFNQRFAGEPIATGLAPGISGAIATVGEQSGKDYAADLTRSKGFQADIYPMQRVLDIVKEEGPKAFGPGTEGLNAVKSALVTWLPNVDQKTIDGVSNYEQAKKYLVQAARTAGNTGTNDQLAAAFEANPNVKMSGATIESVVKSNIALRRMQQAQTLLFGQQNLPPSEYSKWISQNQNRLDPRAFGFDLMDATAKKKLIDSLSKDKKAYQKFETSLQFAHDAELIDKPNRQ